MDKINTNIGPKPLPVESPARKNAEPLHKLKAQSVAAAEQFETMMAAQLVKSMQSSLDGGSLFGEGIAGDVYSGLAEWELARTLTKSAHFGLKEQILRQLPKEEDR